MSSTSIVNSSSLISSLLLALAPLCTHLSSHTTCLSHLFPSWVFDLLSHLRRLRSINQPSINQGNRSCSSNAADPSQLSLHFIPLFFSSSSLRYPSSEHRLSAPISLSTCYPAMTTAKYLRGQPPSPPQSPHSDSLSNSIAMSHSYEHPDSTVKMAYDSDTQPLVSLHQCLFATLGTFTDHSQKKKKKKQAYTSAPSFYVPNSDYSRMLPMQYPVSLFLQF